MLHRDRVRAGSFGNDAERYDRSRPSYPQALADDLVSGLGTSPRVLDVGCGTGIAARLFVARGCTVLGVEPDARMARVARRHGVEVEAGTFEQWEPGGRQFDLLVAGQSWHWVEPDRGAAKAAAVLRAGGRVGLFWNQSLLPAALRRELSAVYRELAPGLDGRSVALGHLSDGRFARTARALVDTGWFHVPALRAYTWRRVSTKQEWLDQLPTHSDHGALAPGDLAALLEAVGGVLERAGSPFELTLRTWLVTARRTAARRQP